MLFRSLPDQVREVIVGAYNDALTPVFAMLIPMVLAGLVIVAFIKEVPLRSTLETGTQEPEGADSALQEVPPAAADGASGTEGLLPAASPRGSASGVPD